ncbi:hypothetical protein [Candidatus Binatus sp.]|uniref:hypothetical protein n=1 Tax=Candidatus Binatus sp. TaxID=2811406 RepID=UPI002FD92DE3
MMRNAANLWRWIWVLNAGLLIVVAKPLYADSDDSLKAQNIELKKQLAEFQTELREMHQRMEALEARVNGSAAKGASAQSAVSANPAASEHSGPPPGVTPAGEPLPASPPAGITLGSAVKKLMPGPVTGPTSLAPAYANAEPGGQGVIVPGLEGVSKTFIPDIGAVGDFTFRQSDIRRGDARYNPADDKFQPRDTQLIFFSPIDPYTTAQISIDKPNNGPFNIEEAFLTFNKLPYDLSLRAGQFRPAFGLLNETDTFQLPMVNRPNALAFYIGDDGLIEPGLNVKGYIPNPWDLALKADFNFVSGINQTAFDRHQGRTYDFAYIGTLDYSRDLFTTGALTTGASFAGGPGPGGATYMEDPFIQLRYAPTQRQVWTWNLEALLSERTGANDHGVKRGIYTLLDYNFRLRWHAGALIDVADVPGVPRGTELGLSPILTYFVSDNTRLRLQYTHTTATQAANGPLRAADVVYLQATFSLGNLKPLD